MKVAGVSKPPKSQPTQIKGKFSRVDRFAKPFNCHPSRGFYEPQSATIENIENFSVAIKTFGLKSANCTLGERRRPEQVSKKNSRQFI